jgi:hypothetical protein
MRVDVDIVSLIIHTIFIIEKIIQDNGFTVWDGEDWVIYQIMAFIIVLCIGLKACWELRRVGGWRTCVIWFKRRQCAYNGLSCRKMGFELSTNSKGVCPV